MTPSRTFAPPALHFEVNLVAPDVSAWREGNTGVPGFITRDSGAPGPHVGLVSLIHGNEIAGAIVLDRLLRSGLTPKRGRLTFGFANLDAFERFDPIHPTASRFVDEDMNRVWDRAVLDGNRESRELARARQMRPLVESFDILLDLHSMLWPSEPLLLCGSAARGRHLAGAIGSPALVVADHGHESGRRLIDHVCFTSPATTAAAALLEAGEHWQRDSVTTTEATVSGLLHHTGLADLPIPLHRAPPRFVEVTQAITATTAQFAFVKAYRGGEIVRRADTLIAMDGTQEIRTPHDNCLLIMPSLRPSRGHTAVRLARAP
jgi:predicted deacylase